MHAPDNQHARHHRIDTRALAWYTDTRHDDTHERGDAMVTKQTDSDEDETIPYDAPTFRVWANSIQKQLDQMQEQISHATAVAQEASMHANTCWKHISKLEREHENTTTAHPLPDSNGFWRDNDGDIWSYDGDPDNPPQFIFTTASQEVCETPTDSTTTWADLEDYAPYTKISNPFPTGDNHADR